MQKAERVNQVPGEELNESLKRDLAVTFHRTIHRLLQQNIDSLRRKLDEFEESVNSSFGREEEFMYKVLSDAEKKLDAKVHIEKNSAGRYTVRLVRPNGKESGLIFDSNKWASFRLDRWIRDTAGPWFFHRWPAFEADMLRGSRILKAVKKGGRTRSESYHERDCQWKDEVEKLQEKGHSIRSACRIIGKKEGENPGTIRAAIYTFWPG